MPVGSQNLVPYWSSSDTCSFLPESWEKALGSSERIWVGCEKWWAQYPVICWLKIARGAKDNAGTISLYAEVGPLSDHGLRKELIEAIQEIAKLKELTQVAFQKGAAEEGRRYSKFLKANQKRIEDVQSVDEISAAVRALLKDFEPCFNALSRAMQKFSEAHPEIPAK